MTLCCYNLQDLAATIQYTEAGASVGCAPPSARQLLRQTSSTRPAGRSYVRPVTTTFLTLLLLFADAWAWWRNCCLLVVSCLLHTNQVHPSCLLDRRGRQKVSTLWGEQASRVVANQSPNFMLARINRTHAVVGTAVMCHNKSLLQSTHTPEKRSLLAFVLPLLPCTDVKNKT